MESSTRREQWTIAIVSFIDSSDPSPSCRSSRAVRQSLSHDRFNWICRCVGAVAPSLVVLPTLRLPSSPSCAMAAAGSEWLVAGTPWYRVEGCPLAHECSRQAFNRSKVWGWAEYEAKERLHHRLLNSSCHKDSFTDSFTPEDAIEGAVVVAEFVTEQEVARQAKQRPQQDWKSGDSKRQRTGDRQVRSPVRELGIQAKSAGSVAQAP